MRFSYIKSFIKENWAAFVTFLLGFGQLYLFICFVQQIARLSKHSDKVNNTFLMILGGSWLFTLAISIPSKTGSSPLIYPETLRKCQDVVKEWLVI